MISIGSASIADPLAVTADQIEHIPADSPLHCVDPDVEQRMIAEIDRYGPDLDLHLVATVEAVVLPQAAELPVGRLQALVRAEVVRRDAEAAERVAREDARTARKRAAGLRR